MHIGLAVYLLSSCFNCKGILPRKKCLDAELSVKYTNGSFVLTDNVQLVVRDILGLLLPLAWRTLAPGAAAVALVVRHDADRIGGMDEM